MTTRVTTKGQITIPKEIRDRAGIRAGDEIEWTEAGGKIVGARVETASPFARWVGAGRSLGQSVDSLIEEMRGR